MCIHHRRSIFCILPPHILSNIAKNGTKEQRDIAIDALGSDHSIRSSRAQLAFAAVPRLASVTAGGAAPAVERTIYDAVQTESLPSNLLRAEGQPAVGDGSANRAYDGLGDTFAFYLGAYERNSIDNHGLPLKAWVHYGSKYDNAFWDGNEMVFGDGDGTLFNDFTSSVDVIGHELTHGVTGSEINLTYQGQSGALNESISDVFGSLVKQYKLGQTADQADWLIGAGLLAPGVKGIALRSMEAPGTAYDDPTLGKDPQPADMAHFLQTTQDNGGVHINSGIPNRAFYLVASGLGGRAWEKAGQIWYDTICDRSVKASSSFVQFAVATAAHASGRFGASSAERAAVVAAWNTVGVKVK